MPPRSSSTPASSNAIVRDARIERHMSPADVTPCAGELALRRQAAFAAEEAPRLHQRTDGDVERAAGLAVIAHRVRDEVEQLLGQPRRDAAPPRWLIRDSGLFAL